METVPLSLYHIIKPSNSNNVRPPVIFLFHGYGSDENDLFSFAADLPSNYFIISARGPFPLPPFGNAWYAINFDASFGKWSDVDQAIISRDKIVAFIDEACEAYQLDQDNVTLLGFSQGTVLSYAVALSFPEKIKNIVALSGYIDEKVLKDNFDENDYKNLDIYASHGQVDQVIPPEWAHRSTDLLKKLGINFKYEEFPVGHGVSADNFYSFRKWLEDKI